MIVAPHADAALAGALRLTARPDEDVVVGPDDAFLAVRYGFPRLAVLLDGRGSDEFRSGGNGEVPVLPLATGELHDWREAWRRGGLPWPWARFLAHRLAPSVALHERPRWVDHTLRDLAALASRPLPPSLSGMGRRVLEHPAAYADLGGLEGLTGLSAGAMKARFRRRSLMSPFSYLRWFRALAAAHVLTLPGVSVLSTAQRLGWTSSGNLFRHVQTTCGLSPSEVRRPGARERLLVHFARAHLSDEALAAWDSLEDLFLRRTA
jgi:AraC-like DNA-binding protein